MDDSRHLGLIGGLGVGAAVLYYQGITTACAARKLIPRLTLAHAHAPNALACVTAGRIDDLAAYLATFEHELARAGCAFFAIPAVTPHICLDALIRRASLPIVDLLQATTARLKDRGLSRVALFGTKFTIDRKLFGVLDAFDVVRPRDVEVDDIHRIYLELATQATTPADNVARLRDLAQTLMRRDGAEAIVLAGTDLNLIFNEANCGFPAVDCLSAHVDAIVERMAQV